MTRKSAYLLSFVLVLSLAGRVAAVDKWWNQDINTTTAGSATERDGAFTVTGNGSDIRGSSDGFHFLYKELTGDGSMTAQVVSQQNTNEWAKAGVMIRETLTPGSKHCCMALTPTASHGVAFQNRTVTGGGTCYSAHQDPGTIDAGLAFGYPYWVRIVREGDEFSGYISEDGVTWTLVPAGTGTDASPNPQINEMAETVYIGLAVTSHAAGYLNPPFAEQTIVHGGAQSMPLDYNNLQEPFYREAEREFAPVQDWAAGGVDTLVLFVRVRAKNVPDPFYVGLEDASGHAVRVSHPDPALVNARQWVEWRIPLADCAGVNPTRVEKIYVGVGNRSDPVAGGTGLIYIDDIYVTKPSLRGAHVRSDAVRRWFVCPRHTTNGARNGSGECSAVQA